MGSIALTVLTLTLGMFFILVGQFKVTPKFFPDVHEDMRQEFGRLNSAFPFYKFTGWRPFAKNYRLAVGIIELVCGAIMVLVPGPLKQLANVILLIIMLGAVYTHYILHDKFERMAPGLVFSLLLLTRLIIYRQVKQREKRVPSEKSSKSSDKPQIEEEDEEEEASDKTQESDKEETRDEPEPKLTKKQKQKQDASPVRASDNTGKAQKKKKEN